MNEQWLMSVIDVAEALRCSVEDVVEFIELGDLSAVAGSPLLVTHVAVREFVTERQRTALQLGLVAGIAPDVVASRPADPGFDHQL